MARQQISLRLVKKKCRPCEGRVRPMTRKQALSYLAGLSDWNLPKIPHLIDKEYRVKDFKSAVRFIDRIAKLADNEGHHPDLHLTHYRMLKIVLSTHAIGGLSENDFILAAKIDKLFA